MQLYDGPRVLPAGARAAAALMRHSRRPARRGGMAAGNLHPPCANVRIDGPHRPECDETKLAGIPTALPVS